ncbi:MAG TPA: ABC transporter ATP-binding protein [Longimicrobiaceae bacterium]|nr:ABC transporter ATP-binding protein [Longimicrobiaceae bacterium]
MAAETVTASALRMADVAVRFGRLQALASVSLDVPRGSITGLIGRNGAGKSTSIRMLAGLLLPDAGSVQVLGRGFAAQATEIRQRTGYLLAEPALFAYLTPRETLAFLAEAYGVERGEASGRVEALLSFFDLRDAADRLVDGFSTGMLKRLGLAAALVHGPELLVLDEPFETLDPLIVRKLKRLLVDYAAAGGSVLLSSHLIDAVDEICDRIAILEKGRVMVAGPTGQAKEGIAGKLGRGSLEELYASVVQDAAAVDLPWLTR